MRKSIDSSQSRSSGTNRGPTVRPLRALDKMCAAHESCAAHISGAVSNRERAEEQVVQNQRRESRRSFADAGWEQQQSPGS